MTGIQRTSVGLIRRPVLKPGGNKLITVTKEASALLETIERPIGTVLRLEPIEGSQGVALAVGDPQLDDLVVEQGGNDLLHVSAAISDLLEGTTIDRVETPTGASLSLSRNSNPPDRTADS